MACIGTNTTANTHQDLEDKLKMLNVNGKENGSPNGDEENCSNNETDGKSEGVISAKGTLLPPGFAVTASNVNDEAYSMNYSRRGHCLVFNHKYFYGATNLGTRSGTNQDRDGVSYLFRCLGFDVEVKNDLTVKGIKDVLNHYACDVDHSDGDCFVVVFMSHGEDGNLFGADNLFKSDLLFSQFTADLCPSLAGKPKMFFIQACRGEGLDAGTKMLKGFVADETDSGAMTMYKIPNHVDFLMCWSTVPGHYSWRNTTNGSWFIQSLCKVFGQHAATSDVLSMMTRVNRHMIQNFESNCPSSVEMHGKKQTASVVSTLMRQIYLKPKK